MSVHITIYQVYNSVAHKSGLFMFWECVCMGAVIKS